MITYKKGKPMVSNQKYLRSEAASQKKLLVVCRIERVRNALKMRSKRNHTCIYIMVIIIRNIHCALLGASNSFSIGR